ncbi:hypothetical protein [Serratia proteamaculans]|uniref:hypothetical protein n=1 Tax=Serratia proteamaculans TaxID=28151 RepID=UPI0039B06712
MSKAPTFPPKGAVRPKAPPPPLSFFQHNKVIQNREGIEIKGNKYSRIEIKERGRSLIICGEWVESGCKCGGVICLAYLVGDQFVVCHPRTGEPMSIHRDFAELKRYIGVSS